MHRRQASATLRKIKRDNRHDTSPNLSRSSFETAPDVHMERGSAHSVSSRSVQQDEADPLLTKSTRSLEATPAAASKASNHSHRSMSSSTSLIPSPDKYSWKKDLRSSISLIVESKASILLLLWPFAVWSGLAHWQDGWVFALNFIVMIPLAKLLGDATEILAIHMGQTIGGLINATFGNAVEVVIAIFALRANEIRVVQASMIGSILSNLLLVLGCCFVAAGFFYKESHFNPVGASANSSLLMLSALAMLIPTPFAAFSQSGGQSAIPDNPSASIFLSQKETQAEENIDHVLQVSRLAACFLLFMYLQLLFFQLRTHIYLFDSNDEDEEPEISTIGSAVFLASMTLLIAMHSEFLVGSLDGMTKQSGLSKSFVGVILLPIVGNAVEHVTAVSVAIKGKMELAMGVAVGSATQVSMFVVPVIVLIGWAMDREMSLSFPLFEVSVYLMSVIIVYAIIADGKSNWLEGTSLLTAYSLIAVAIWYEQASPAISGVSHGKHP